METLAALAKGTIELASRIAEGDRDAAAQETGINADGDSPAHRHSDADA